MDQLEIQLSKTKLTLMAIGSLAFVIAGICGVINPTRFISFLYRSPTFIFLSGLAGIIFFGFVGFYLLKKLFDKKPGLIISNNGIVDNSSGISVGFVPWSDIKEIKETMVANQKFINLIVKNPQHYIEGQPTKLKRWIVKRNYKSFGTPIGISANGLKYNYDELKLLLQQRFEQYKSEHNK
jgi:hypothetical protein